ncbi:MAG TPA: hypothetical protein VFQ05_16660 [Candidatus Eisenbacteria bacterium]|nr:hypothetical protein [Candidatus Eisenbacteria bacterium]
MDQEQKVRAGLSEAEMKDNLVRLAFGGEPRRLEEFLDVLRREIPANTAAVMRGSSVTGKRWNDEAPFDAEGPKTSDLDLTLVGGEILDYFHPEGFYIAGIHSKPLSDKDPDIAPRLLPLRRRLMALVGRPVDIQGTRDWVMFVREYLMGQPYLTLIGKLEQP